MKIAYFDVIKGVLAEHCRRLVKTAARAHGMPDACYKIAHPGDHGVAILLFGE